MRRLALVPLLMLLALVVEAGPALAQTSKDSPGRIGPETATSQCLGQPSTPVCATETLLACLVRGEAALCRAVGAPAQRLGAEKQQSEYVIERVSIIRPEDVTEDLRDLEWFRPGYALVEAQRRACPSGEVNCGDESWEDLQVYLRQSPGAATPSWEVVHWRSESEPDVPQDLADDPQRKAP